MRSVAASALALLIALWLSMPAHAEGRIVGLNGVDELELYPSTDEDADAVLSVGAAELGLPTPMLDVSNNGMLKLTYQGREYWVIADDVKTDTTRKVDTGGCGPKVASTLVTHGKRGAGEGCQ